MTGPGGCNAPYPDFLGIGAQKSGTTWLSRHLQFHPQIWMPPIKELHYFDERINDPANAVSRLSGKLFGRRLVDYRWRRQVRTRTRKHLKRLSSRKLSREALLWDLRYYWGAPGDKWYASLFEGGGENLIGEITPAYSTLDKATIAHIHELMPQAKIVFFMRSPIERAWSQAVMQFDKIHKRDIGTVTEQDLHRNFGSEGSRARTDYQSTLENWGSFYPEEGIFVGFLEDIHFFPEELLRNLYKFLGVDPHYKPPGVDRRVHSRSAGRVPTSSVAHLARIYRHEIAFLSERFGGYASFWHFCAERLVNDPPSDEQMPYPLWESPWWDEWKGPREIRLQSGPLSSFLTSP